MKKYRVSVQLDREFCGSCIGVTWPGFTIGMATEDGANALAAELNRLDARVTELDRSVQVQVEAKNAALTRIKAFETHEEDLVTWFRGAGLEWGLMGDGKNWTPQETALAALQELTSRNVELMRDERYNELGQLCEERGQKLARTIAAQRLISKQLDAKRELCEKLVTAIRESQKILAAYLEPHGHTGKRQKLDMHDTLTQLLEVLDHRDLVALVQGGAALCDDGHCDHAAIPHVCIVKPTNWPHWATHLFRDKDGWHFGKLMTQGYWIDSDSEVTASQCWNRQNMIDGTLEERPSVTLKISTNDAGQRYLAGLGVGVDSSPFILKAERFAINGAMIADGKLAVGTAMHEAIERVVNNTTNHFAPEPKASKKQLAALLRASEYFSEEGHNKQTAKHLRRLLKKLS